MRLALWQESDLIIKTHNADETNTHILSHNFLSDYTEAEKANLRGYKEAPKINSERLLHDGSPLPNAVNWVTAGKVGPVKD